VGPLEKYYISYIVNIFVYQPPFVNRPFCNISRETGLKIAEDGAEYFDPGLDEIGPTGIKKRMHINA